MGLFPPRFALATPELIAALAVVVTYQTLLDARTSRPRKLREQSEQVLQSSWDPLKTPN